jgi:biotin carboxyl carrier protein
MVAMTRIRVTDRATGEIVVELDPAEGREPAEATEPADPADLADPAAARRAPPGDRPIVLPSSNPATARGRVALEVVVAGWRFELEAEDAYLADLRARAASGRETAVRHGPTEVRAIIPGRVVSVAVEAGDAVTSGQRLLAVEAMKMENELRAPRAGTVERVAVAVGETVELGDALVVLR